MSPHEKETAAEEARLSKAQAELPKQQVAELKAPVGHRSKELQTEAVIEKAAPSVLEQAELLKIKLKCFNSLRIQKLFRARELERGQIASGYSRHERDVQEHPASAPRSSTRIKVRPARVRVSRPARSKAPSSRPIRIGRTAQNMFKKRGGWIPLRAWSRSKARFAKHDDKYYSNTILSSPTDACSTDEQEDDAVAGVGNNAPNPAFVKSDADANQLDPPRAYNAPCSAPTASADLRVPSHTPTTNPILTLKSVGRASM